MPAHLVYLDTFYLDVYLITNALHRLFAEATGHKPPDCWDDPNFSIPDHPVVGVGWSDATAYVTWAGKRLPTEAEWEKAARGVLEGRLYPWGDAPIDGSQCNLKDSELSDVDDGYAYTSPVGTYPPNGYGQYDMNGNVWEWCYNDCRAYTSAPGRNPVGPLTEGRRARRGGDWAGPMWHHRCAR